MHIYRTHTCGDLRKSDVKKVVKLSGWIHRKRDHGDVVFIDLRDHYGITQCIIEANHPQFQNVVQLKLETVISVKGETLARSDDTINPELVTGDIEVSIEDITVLGMAEPLPLQVNSDQDTNEELRLTYRFLDLRRLRIHQNILLRSQIIARLREKMIAQGFVEFQTPILTASSPEGARDFLVPSRLHPGKFYALPQAPQQFKQLLMVAGFDKYFQIAPCFRDEDSRADRSPGEFYQLDFEMSFVTQDDVFRAIEPVLHDVFTTFAKGKTVSPYPFVQIPYDKAMLDYGTDKPDLRNPIIIKDASPVFSDARCEFKAFKHVIENGGVVRAIPAPKTASNPRSFFDKYNEWAKSLGAPGLGYIVFDEENQAKGPIAKFLTAELLSQLQRDCALEAGDSVFFTASAAPSANHLAGLVRQKLGADLGLIDETHFAFCWIVDFPMYEKDETTGKIIFSHNPFSMPQGEMEALQTKDPLTIKAFQYDIVCNGVELSSGAIRNHRPDIMFKAFEIAGYSRDEVEAQFGGLLNAFRYGAPPHGGCAPGVDRIVMLLAGEPNIREVIAFPMNQKAEDLMMQAPTEIDDTRLKELHIKRVLPLKVAKSA